MNENTVTGLEAGADEFECCINNLFGNICRVGCIDKVEDKAIASPGNEIFRVILRGCSLSVSYCLTVVWLFAGMDNTPSRFVLDPGFVVVFVTNEEVGKDFNHIASLCDNDT
jgi:hypothetical protein